MALEPIKLYWRNQIPYPSKVLIVLEELNLPYETIWVELEGLKQKPFTDVNPNGGIAATIDPNTGLTLWESGAIVQYGESPESAKLRYGAELKRIVGVLDNGLSKQEWLVGDKCTYADLAFVMWSMQIPFFMASRTGEHAWKPEEVPHFTRWQNTMMARPSVLKAISVFNHTEVKSS
ncbi:glutathione S-transferase [Penicillium malachiteum]|nr:glutathione S-transferase [Penicillium malachiteum]